MLFLSLIHHFYLCLYRTPGGLGLITWRLITLVWTCTNHPLWLSTHRSGYDQYCGVFIIETRWSMHFFPRNMRPRQLHKLYSFSIYSSCFFLPWMTLSVSFIKLIWFHYSRDCANDTSPYRYHWLLQAYFFRIFSLSSNNPVSTIFISHMSFTYLIDIVLKRPLRVFDIWAIFFLIGTHFL